MGEIKVTDLLVRAIIGFKDWERKKKQDIKITYTLRYDSSRAEISDNISDSVDYKIINKKIIKHVEESNHSLIEKVAKDILDILLENKKVLEAEVEVEKPHALRFSESVSFKTTGNKN